MFPIRIFALFSWVGLLAVGAKLGLSLASLPATGAFQFNLKGYVTLALPAFFCATASLWMRGHPLDMKQTRGGVDGRFVPGTYNRFIHMLRPLPLLAAFGAVVGGYATGLFFVVAAVGFMVCLLLRARAQRRMKCTSRALMKARNA